jgi:uncharacterized protein YggE
MLGPVSASVLRRPRLALLLAGAALCTALVVGAPAHAAPADSTSGITVSGQGIVSAPPDTVTLQIGVSIQAASVADARTQAATAASAVTASVKGDGVADADIQTVQFSISPQYDYSGSRQTLTGYRVDNVLQVKIRNLDSVGKVIDDAVAAGGNAVVIRGIAFSIENTDTLLHQARLMAMQDAQTKAQDYASAASVSLGKVISIDETQSQRPTPVFVGNAAPTAAVAAAPPTPVQSGTQQIQVNVTVTYAIQ